MRCCFPPCDRKVGLRKYCPPHRIWVAYLKTLKHANCHCPDHVTRRTR
jgi:hypothetical protein